MMRLLFYVMYAARNLWRSRRWSAFALFSVAAGVATVVAFRSLGLAIGDSLNDSARASLKGDILFTTQSDGFFSFSPNGNSSVFSPGQVKILTDYANERGWGLTAFSKASSMQITRIDEVRVGRPQFVTAFHIDPDTYPPTGEIRALDPAGVPLRELFSGEGREVVISQNLAEAERISVGDSVRVTGTTEEFVVRGIVGTENEAGLREIFAAFFGFAYFDRDQMIDLIDLDPLPSSMSVTLPDGTPHVEIMQETSRLLDLLRGSPESTTWMTATSYPRVLEQNQAISDVIGRFVVALALGALLIGGVGIINTMLVMVRRRTNEIASLKTFGVKGRQVAFMFMVEAFIIGTLGSLLGALLGTLLAGFANQFGATLIQQPLPWRLYPEAVWFGLVLGVVISVVFGILPVITAMRIRPAIILRPNEAHIPVAGFAYSLLAMLVVVATLGVIAGQVVGNLLVGVIAVIVTLLLLGLLVLIMWLIVWLIGRVPSFGNVDLRLALRNLTTRRTRTATTLLALSAGMFALSSITFFGASFRQILNFTLSESLGGNVMVFTLIPGAFGQQLIDSRLDALEGVDYRTRWMRYGGQIVSVNDVPVDVEGLASPDSIRRQIAQAARRQDFNEVQRLTDQLNNALDVYLDVSVRETNNPSPPVMDVIAGRGLTPGDAGQAVGVMTDSPTTQALGIGVGSRVVVDFYNNGRREIEIVGLAPALDPNNFQSQMQGGDLVLPPQYLPSNAGDGFALNIAQVRPENLNQVLLDLSAIPLVFSIDITFIDGVLSRFIAQFSALPVLVGIFSLGAAAVIMANTVALATLERRRQIGILKAVGLRRGRVLRIMLLENTLISLLGGVLGIGLSALGVWLMTTFGLEDAILIPPEALPAALVLVGAAILIGIVATLLSAGVAVRERVLNVLRYE